MDNNFWKDIIKYIPSKLIPSITGFLMLIILTRYLTPEEFGLYNLVITTTGILTTVFIGWISRSSLRFYQKFKEQNKLNEYIFFSFFTVILIGVIISLIYVILYKLEVVFVNDIFSSLMLIGIWLVLTKGIVELILNFNRASQNSLSYSLYQSLYSLGKVIFVFIFFNFTNLKVEAVLLSYLISEMFIILLERMCFKSKSKKQKISLFNMNIEKLKFIFSQFFKKTAKYGFPAAGVSIIATILSAGDRYIIQFYLGETKVGIYSAAYKIGKMSIHSIFMLLMLAAFPIIVNSYEKKGKQVASRIITKHIGYYFLVLTPAFFGLWSLSREITYFILGQKFYSSYYILPMVSLGVYFYGLTLYINKPFELKEKTIILFYIISFSAILNIILNIFFVNFWGIAGAAYSTVISYLFYLIISYIYSNKFMHIKIPFNTCLKSVIGSFFMYIVITYTKSILLINNIYLLIFYIIFGLVIYLFILLLLKEKNFIILLNKRFS